MTADARRGASVPYLLVVYEYPWIELDSSDDVVLDPGQCFVVRKGMRHNPVAEEEVGIVLIETVTTAHTGSEQTDRTVTIER